MNKLSKILLISLSIILLSCGNNRKAENVTEETNQTEKPISNLKISIFNDPTKLLSKLSEIGIGELKEWKNPEEMGWGSMTDYYQFGAKKDGVGMQNNLAYYIEGEENFAKSLLLNLNINNEKSKKEALKLFSETAEKTFKSLETEIPKGLLESIKSSKDFKVENENMIVNFTVEQSGIEVMKLEIISK